MITIEFSIAAAISVLALMAVAVPMLRGLRAVFRGRVATRMMVPEEIEQQLSNEPAPGEPLGVLMARALRGAQEDDGEDIPVDFVRDAARQYVLNEYEVHYAEPVAMYANILPPIGFIGTTVGMLVLFISMHLSNQTLQLGALGVALTSTIFALIGLATLESMKIGNYDRLLRCIDASLPGGG